MQISAFALAILSCWFAHVAGAGYVVANEHKKRYTGAFFRTLISVILLAIALHIAGQ